MSFLGSAGWKAKVRVPAGLVPSVASVLDLPLAFSPSSGLILCVFLLDVSSFSYKDTSPVGLGPHLRTSFSSFKALFPNIVTWGVGISACELVGEAQFSPYYFVLRSLRICACAIESTFIPSQRIQSLNPFQNQLTVKSKVPLTMLEIRRK